MRPPAHANARAALLLFVCLSTATCAPAECLRVTQVGAQTFNKSPMRTHARPEYRGGPWGSPEREKTRTTIKRSALRKHRKCFISDKVSRAEIEHGEKHVKYLRKQTEKLRRSSLLTPFFAKSQMWLNGVCVPLQRALTQRIKASWVYQTHTQKPHTLACEM